MFYPGFANRFHRAWEASYWPCKAACVKEKQCERHYFEGKVWECKGAALSAHDAAIALPATPELPALNVTPPFMMRAFYGARVKLLAIIRSPIDRVRHAFYRHPHYRKRYGEGAPGFEAYAKEQVRGWHACAGAFGVRRCAVHFEQLGAEPNDVFFHCDQLIRSMYSAFVRDWLGAFPDGQLLLLRTEDFLDARRATLRRAWRHLGLTPLDFGRGVSFRFEQHEKRLPSGYREWTQGTGPISSATTALLQEFYRPFNRELRDLLVAHQPAMASTCNAAADSGVQQDAPPNCEKFLWEVALD